jgi:hypothetical protein
MKKILLISFVSTFIFGLINATFLLFTIKTFEEKLKKTAVIDEVSSELLTGGISSAMALFVATNIRYRLHETYKILDNPAIDSVGIILGTISVILIHKYWKKHFSGIEKLKK